MSDLILAIDQGTHATRAIVFDSHGRVVSSAQQSIALQVHSRTEIEQSPAEILQSLWTVLESVFDHPAIDRQRIRCAGMATQRSSVVAWDRRNGQALGPVISWQDRRTADGLHRLDKQSSCIQQLTGLRLSPHYGASKLQWLLENNTAVATALDDDALVMGPLASYLLHHLTDNRNELVDHANASRTLLWNLVQRDWDRILLGYFHIPPRVLPQCKPICNDYGALQGSNISVRAVNGDQTAALYSRGMPCLNTVTVNIGTGAFVLLPVDDPSIRPDGLLAGISHSSMQSGSYYIEGTVNAAGAALEWAARSFGLDDFEQRLPDWLEAIEAATLFVNTLGGLGSPWWREGPPAHFLDAGVSGPEALVAVVESCIFLLQANIALLQTVNPAVDIIQISGGLARLDGLCQRLANLTALTVYRPVEVEATARGIAWQAAGGPADWPDTGDGDTFAPIADPGIYERYDRFMKIINNL